MLVHIFKVFYERLISSCLTSVLEVGKPVFKVHFSSPEVLGAKEKNTGEDSFPCFWPSLLFEVYNFWLM